jgi:hypothetical protein
MSDAMQSSGLIPQTVLAQARSQMHKAGRVGQQDNLDGAVRDVLVDYVFNRSKGRKIIL